jgi:hypothetical protein
MSNRNIILPAPPVAPVESLLTPPTNSAALAVPLVSQTLGTPPVKVGEDDTEAQKTALVLATPPVPPSAFFSSLDWASDQHYRYEDERPQLVLGGSSSGSHGVEGQMV